MNTVPLLTKILSAASDTKLLPNEFYVFGESYGGHYVPAISKRIYDGNQNNEGLKINLAGLGVGNGSGFEYFNGVSAKRMGVSVKLTF